MIDFVGTPPFLRIPLRVAMVKHAFLHSPNRFILGDFFRIQGTPGNNLAPMKKCPGVQGGSN